MREKLSQVETERQNLLATQQMWESAIAQISAAKSLEAIAAEAKPIAAIYHARVLDR